MIINTIVDEIYKKVERNNIIVINTISLCDMFDDINNAIRKKFLKNNPEYDNFIDKLNNWMEEIIKALEERNKQHLPKIDIRYTIIDKIDNEYNFYLYSKEDIKELNNYKQAKQVFKHNKIYFDYYNKK